MNHNKIIKLLFLSISLVISSCSTSISSNSSFSSYSSIDSISSNETNSSFSTSLSPNSSISSNGDTSSFSSRMSSSDSPSSFSSNADSIPSSSVISSSKEESSVPIHEHVFSDWFTINEPTCTESGLEKRTCSCGYEETRLIDPLNHNYSNEWTIDIEATCNKEGSKSHHCLRCDNKTDITIIPKLDHVPGTPIKENNVEPTCSKKGSYDLVTYCVNCGEKLNIEHFDVDAYAHQLNEPTFIWNEYESCEATSICLVCQETITLSASISNVVINAPSCTDEGLEEYTASISINNQTYSDKKEKILEPLGHSYSDWDVIKEANDYQDGLRKKECSRCHDVVEEIVPTTSPFTFSLNKDGESYTVNTKNGASCFEESIIHIPDSFNNMPVNAISLSIKCHSNPTTFINLKENNVKIQKLELTFIEDDNNPSIKGIAPANEINIIYDGDINSWMQNISVDNQYAFGAAPIKLHLLGDDNNYHLLEELKLEEGIETIGNFKFTNIQFLSLTCPSTLKSINRSAFAYNFALERIILNEGLKTIGTGAFTFNRIKEITIPSSISSSTNAFMMCPRLTEITINEGAQNVNANTFIDCPHLAKILNYSNSNYPTDNCYMTLTNSETSDLFVYQDFLFLKIENNFYLVARENEDSTVRLPSTIIYKNEEITSYSIRTGAFSHNIPIPLNFNSLEYDSLETIRKRATAAFYGDIFDTLYISKAVNYLQTNAFGATLFLKKLYYEGTIEEWYTLLETYVPNFPNQTLFYQSSLNNIIYAKNESDQYQEYSLTRND